MSEKALKVREWFDKTFLEPRIVEENLGIKENRITPHLLLTSSHKLIKINRGEAKEDDRENLKFANVNDLSHFVQEHIEHDTAGLFKKARMKIKQKRNLDWLHSGYFTPLAKAGAMGESSLTQLLDDGSPIQIQDVSHRVTKLGMGAIRNESAISDSARQLHPSHLGLMTPEAKSEGFNIGAVLGTANNVRIGRDKRFYKKVIDNRTNKPVWLDHITYLNSKIEIPEE